MTRTRQDFAWLTAILAIQTSLIVGIAMRNAPNADEPAHLAAGIYHWQTGRMDAYLVNPPLVRLWCTWPLVGSPDLPAFQPSLAVGAERHEWQLARQLWDHWGTSRMYEELVRARCRNLPFPLLGTLYCGLLATRLFGPSAGRVAMVLWAFSPNQLAWAASLCPDIHAVGIGVAAQYHALRWSESNRPAHLVLAAGLAGLAALAKSTWLFFLPIVLLQSMATTWIRGTRGKRQLRVGVALRSLLLFAVIYLATVHAGYAWDGAGHSLSELPARSHMFQQLTTWLAAAGAPPWSLADVPLPLPAAYVQGLDLQRFDFEQGKRSYLFGTWRNGGWWYYYLVCLGLKVPAGYLLLVASRAGYVGWSLRLKLRARAADPHHTSWISQSVRADNEWLWLGVPFVAFLAIVSSQTGFSHHFRYAFPCLPYLYVFGSGMIGGSRGAFPRAALTWSAVILGVLSSLSSWPTSHSFVSLVAGGPYCGYKYLAESNLDWGEDLAPTVAWARRHPHLRPLYHAVVTDDIAQRMDVDWQPARDAVRSGWYVVSRQRTMDPTSPFAVFRDRKPCAVVTPAVVVYEQR